METVPPTVSSSSRTTDHRLHRPLKVQAVIAHTDFVASPFN